MMQWQKSGIWICHERVWTNRTGTIEAESLCWNQDKGGMQGWLSKLYTFTTAPNYSESDMVSFLIGN